MEGERLNDKKIAIAYLFAIFFVTAVIAFTCNVFADGLNVRFSTNDLTGKFTSREFEEGTVVKALILYFDTVEDNFIGTLNAKLNSDIASGFKEVYVNVAFSDGTPTLSQYSKAECLSYVINGESYFYCDINLDGYKNIRQVLIAYTGNYEFQENVILNIDGFSNSTRFNFGNLSGYLNKLLGQLSIEKIVLIVSSIGLITIGIVFIWWATRKIYVMFMAATKRGKQRT